MAFDGITVANIVKECSDRLVGGRIYKIAQPEKDELLLTIKANGGQQRLSLSVDASLPFCYMTDQNKPSPMVAPNFCMLLRKHLQNAKIISITQPGLERIIRIEAEHLNELGDLCRKFLIIELMGKHSNIIFCNHEEMMIDSIKHISGMVSSVREVLPGRTYFVPETQDKYNPMEIGDSVTFWTYLETKALPVYKAVYSTYTGLSPVISNEICYRAKVDSQKPAQALTLEERERLWDSFRNLIEQVKSGVFVPNIVYENKLPQEYASTQLTIYEEGDVVTFPLVSQLLETYYAQRNQATRIRQKSVDLRKIVQTVLERNIKKYDLQKKQMEDTYKKDKFKVYGELLNTYGYEVEEGASSMEALNYYTNEMITIPLESNLTVRENAQKYFDKYTKYKRTFEALTTLLEETREEVEHLESISTSLEIALQEEDLVQIKEELVHAGYIRKKGKDKKEKITSKPFHYISSDGFHMYVGKNNYQNEEITFKLATGNDWWFHAKGVPGSHVIIKSNGEELPDRTFEEAGRLAAFYSKVRGQEKAEVDYTLKKNVKKPGGGKPGFVVYYTNFSLLVNSDIAGIALVE